MSHRATKPQPTTQSQTTGVVPIIAPHLLTIKAAAAYLSVAVWAVRTLIWEKQIRSLRIGRRIVIPRDELDAYINQALANV